MSYQLIKPELNNDASITLHCRDSNFKKHKIQVLGFKPYFYVPLDDPVPESEHIIDTEDNFTNDSFTSVYGDKLKKIICDNPLSVWDSQKKRGLRTKFTRHFEADIPFLRRFLIDTGITNGFKLLNNSDVIRYTDLKPSEPPSDNTLIAMLDIEVLSTKRFPDPEKAENPVTIATLWNNQNKKYLTIILDSTNSRTWRTDDWLVVHTTNEEVLLTILIDYLIRLQPDVLGGWNIDFDITYLQNRCRKKNLILNLDGTCVFDIMAGYAIIHRRLGNRLKEVAEEDKLLDIYLEFKQEMWTDPTRRDEGIHANKSHVQVLVIEDEHRKIIPFFWGLKQTVGLEDMYGTTSHGILVDTLFLRESHNLYVLPSANYDETSKGFKGAIVLEPKRGIFSNVGAYDMSRYYPNIVIGYKISPDEKGELGPNVCKKLMKQREKFESAMTDYLKIENHTVKDQEYKLLKDRRDEVKYLLNSVWGYYGWSGSRIFEQPKAARVAEKARNGLVYIKTTAETHDLQVLYGDTDSIYIQTNKLDPNTVTDMLNNALKEYCTKENINTLLSIKLDRFYRNIIFTDAKKRTAGWVTFENGKDCDYIEVKGWDSVRRDSSHLTREILPKIFDAVLRSGTNGLSEYIKETEQKIRKKQFDLDYIAINKQLHKVDITEPTIDFYVGSVKANKYFNFDIQSGDMVKMIPVKMIYGCPEMNVLCYLDKDSVPWSRVVIDYDRIITRTLKNRVKEILSIAGMSWDEIMGTKNLKKLWG